MVIPLDFTGRGDYCLFVGFLRDRHDRRILDAHPIPETIWARIVAGRRELRGLSGDEMDRLRRRATIFLHDKVWETPGIPELAETERVEISALAALPVLGLDLSWYDNWRTVVVVPRPFVENHVSHQSGWVVAEWEETDAGESWQRGPVVLSLRDIRASRLGTGHNVVIHEATHRLDQTDGEMNGRPALHRGMDGAEWFRICGAAYADLRDKLERGRRTRIDPYAATNDAEFFAVVTETFFERPQVLRFEYPDLYRLFVEFYRQDPAERVDRVSGPRPRLRMTRRMQ